VSRRCASPDSNGQYSFEGLRPGYYRLSLRSPDPNGRTRWFPPLSQTLEIEIPAGAAIEADLDIAPLRYR